MHFWFITMSQVFGSFILLAFGFAVFELAEYLSVKADKIREETKIFKQK